MTYYPIRLPIKAWQYLGDGFGTQSFQDWIAAELPQYIDAIKCEELWQNSMLSITFPIGDIELDFDMVAVFPGEKKTIKKIKYRDKLHYFYAGEYLLYSQECFYCYGRKAYEALH